MVLEPAVAAAVDARAYLFDKVLFEQPKKGVTLFLATPLLPEAAVDPQQSTLLVGSGSSPVVIKVMPHPQRPTHKGCVDDALAEIGALQLLQQQPHHSNTIHLLDCMQDKDFLYLVLPYLSGGDLFSLVEEAGDQPISESTAASYIRQMAKGLLFMKQTAGLAHHDVSLENVMLTDKEQGQVKIIDLGMCLRVPDRTCVDDDEPEPVYLRPQRCRGKPSYLAPEVVLEEPCDPFAADVWSLGICMYILLTGRPLYSSPHDQAFKAMARGGVRQVVALYETFGLHLSPCAKDLVCSMLDADATQRPTLEEVLEHPFLAVRRTPMVGEMVIPEEECRSCPSTPRSHTNPITGEPQQPLAIQ